MQLILAFFLSLASTIHQGEEAVDVFSSMYSFALVYISQFLRDSRSIGESFHCFNGSFIRIIKRRCCSSSEIENQYFTRIIPDRMSMFSNSGTSTKNCSY